MFQRQTMSWREPPPEDEKKLTASYPPDLRAFQQCLSDRMDKRMTLTVIDVCKVSHCLASATLVWKSDECAQMAALVDSTIARVLDEGEWGGRVELYSAQMNDDDDTYAVAVSVQCAEAHRRRYQLKSAMYVSLLLGLVWLLFYVLHLLWHILN